MADWWVGDLVCQMEVEKAAQLVALVWLLVAKLAALTDSMRAGPWAEWMVVVMVGKMVWLALSLAAVMVVMTVVV